MNLTTKKFIVLEIYQNKHMRGKFPIVRATFVPEPPAYASDCIHGFGINISDAISDVLEKVDSDLLERSFLHEQIDSD